MIYIDATSKKHAIRIRNEQRAQGKTAKAYCHSGIATVPFQGITSFCNYYVKVGV